MVEIDGKSTYSRDMTAGKARSVTLQIPDNIVKIDKTGFEDQVEAIRAQYGD